MHTSIRTKLFDDIYLCSYFPFMYAHNEEEVVLKCAQTVKKLEAKVGDLSREDQQPQKEKDLTKGSNLVVTTNGIDYPLSFVDFASNAIQEPRFPLKPAVTNKRTTLEAAKKEVICKCFILNL